MHKHFFTNYFHRQSVETLRRMYRSVDDIDFFVGGMSEKPVSSGLLGWTFLCVVGDQFARLKKGDRYFYEFGGQPGSFNKGWELIKRRPAMSSLHMCMSGK